ncbi:MAG: GGDEF domain-containing protein [Nevskia sp.]|nr:GGDEF domain-containing protein [Nevskia sp.]
MELHAEAPHAPPEEKGSGWMQSRAEMLRSDKPWFRFALRLHAFYLTTVLHVMLGMMMALSTWFGIEPLAVTLNCIVALALSDALFFYILKSGYNMRLRDPTMIVPRCVAVIATMLYAQIYVGHTKACCVFVIILTFVLAGSHAALRTMLRLNLLTVLAATIPLMRRVEGARFEGHAELINWLSFTCSLPAAVVAGGAINTLRRSLAFSNVRLTELATTDELTGAYNRRYVTELMTHEYHRYTRVGAPFCVCLLDLDHFKRINDIFGHQAGDAALKAFTAAATAAKREGDLFSRWGGEEFLLFMPQCNLAAARTCAERIRRETEELCIADCPPELRVSVSVGVAEYSPGESVAALVERADQALYRAKQGGRNRVEAASPVLLTTAQPA